MRNIVPWLQLAQEVSRGQVGDWIRSESDSFRLDSAPSYLYQKQRQFMKTKNKRVSDISVFDEEGLDPSSDRRATGLDQPKVSHLLPGRLSGSSADRLLAILIAWVTAWKFAISAKERTPERLKRAS